MRPAFTIIDPPSSAPELAMQGLGDPQFAFRMAAMRLQAFGDSGGRATAMADYDYRRLTAWYYILDELHPWSQMVPYLAAYYYGSYHESAPRIQATASYLAYSGVRSGGAFELWRWPAHASYLAPHVLKDPARAMAYAYFLRESPAILPGWGRILSPILFFKAGYTREAFRQLQDSLIFHDKHLPDKDLFYILTLMCQSRYEYQPLVDLYCGRGASR